MSRIGAASAPGPDDDFDEALAAALDDDLFYEEDASDAPQERPAKVPRLESQVRVRQRAVASVRSKAHAGV